MPRLRAAVLGLILCLLPGSARAFDTVLETEHMRLLYMAGPHGYIAPHTARTFENAYAFYADLLGYESGKKVNVILADIADYGNAAAWVAPRNSIFMHMAPPNFVYETGPSNERMNFTMNHEMAHIVGHDQNRGWDAFFRAMFLGKVRAESRHPESILYSYLTVPRHTAPAGITRGWPCSSRPGWRAASAGCWGPTTRWCSGPWWRTAAASTTPWGWSPRARASTSRWGSTPISTARGSPAGWPWSTPRSRWPSGWAGDPAASGTTPPSSGRCSGWA